MLSLSLSSVTKCGREGEEAEILQTENIYSSLAQLFLLFLLSATLFSN